MSTSVLPEVSFLLSLFYYLNPAQRRKGSSGLDYRSYSHPKEEKNIWLGAAPQLANSSVSAEATGVVAHLWVTSGLFQREQGAQVTLPNISPAQL